MPINDSPESTWGRTPNEKMAWVRKYSPKSEKHKAQDISSQPVVPKSEEEQRMDEWAEEHRGPFTAEIPEDVEEVLEDDVEVPEDVELPEDDVEVPEDEED